MGEAYGFEVGEVGLVLALVVTHYLCTPTPVAVQDRPKGRGLVLYKGKLLDDHLNVWSGVVPLDDDGGRD